jgi:molecular chaperone HtpG
LLDAKQESKPELDGSVSALLTFMKNTLGELVLGVRPSDRLTDSAVCLAAPEHGPDRQLEKILVGAGRLKTTAQPILEINPRHDIVQLISSVPEEGRELKQDAVHLLFEQARILDGDRSDNPREFSDRMARVLKRALATKGS